MPTDVLLLYQRDNCQRRAGNEGGLASGWCGNVNTRIVVVQRYSRSRHHPIWSAGACFRFLKFAQGGTYAVPPYGWKRPVERTPRFYRGCKMQNGSLGSRSGLSINLDTRWGFFCGAPQPPAYKARQPGWREIYGAEESSQAANCVPPDIITPIASHRVAAEMYLSVFDRTA